MNTYLLWWTATRVRGGVTDRTFGRSVVKGHEMTSGSIIDFEERKKKHDGFDSFVVPSVSKLEDE